MPIDAPPPMGPPPPSAGGPPPPDPTQVGALSDMAGMGAGGGPMDMVTTLRMAAEFLSKAAQQAQAQGDMPTATQLAQALNSVTTVAQTLLQGQLAGPMAGNGMGAPPPPGPAPASMPGMSSPNQGPPPGMAAVPPVTPSALPG